MRSRMSRGGKSGGWKLSIVHIILLFSLTCVFMIIFAVQNLSYDGVIKESESVLLAVENQILRGRSSQESFELARTESLGFFTDIPESTWKRHKQRFQLTQPNYDDSDKADFERLARYSNHFWSKNFEPEFTCPHEFRLGKLGDGGKWACDPHRIAQTNENGKCIVYSIGSNGNFVFEAEVFKHVSKDCEIHTFDINAMGRRKVFADEAKKAGVNFHHWGLGPVTNAHSNMKTFKEMIVALKHEKGTIDLMKIDCERCEYDQYQQWLKDWKELGMTVRQVMIELHNSDMPTIVDIFKEFQKAGYVMFHKEANYENEGKAIEAAFLLLSPEFQKM